MRLTHVGFCLAFFPCLVALTLPCWSRGAVEPQAAVQAASVAADYAAGDVLGGTRSEKLRERTDLDSKPNFLGKLLVALQTADGTSKHAALHGVQRRSDHSLIVAATLQIVSVRLQI